MSLDPKIWTPEEIQQAFDDSVGSCGSLVWCQGAGFPNPDNNGGFIEIATGFYNGFQEVRVLAFRENGLVETRNLDPLKIALAFASCGCVAPPSGSGSGSPGSGSGSGTPSGSGSGSGSGSPSGSGSGSPSGASGSGAPSGSGSGGSGSGSSGSGSGAPSVGTIDVSVFGPGVLFGRSGPKPCYGFQGPFLDLFVPANFTTWVNAMNSGGGSGSGFYSGSGSGAGSWDACFEGGFVITQTGPQSATIVNPNGGPIPHYFDFPDVAQQLPVLPPPNLGFGYLDITGRTELVGRWGPRPCAGLQGTLVAPITDPGVFAFWASETSDPTSPWGACYPGLTVTVTAPTFAEVINSALPVPEYFYFPDAIGGPAILPVLENPPTSGSGSGSGGP